MKKIFVAFIISLMTSGCYFSDESKTKKVCKDIVLTISSDPDALVIHRISYKERDLTKDEFIRLEYGDASKIDVLSAAVLKNRFSEGGSGAQSMLVSIDYTSKEALGSVRDVAMCGFFKYGNDLTLDAFSVMGEEVNRKNSDFSMYFISRSRSVPDRLGYRGRIE